MHPQLIQHRHSFLAEKNLIDQETRRLRNLCYSTEIPTKL